MRLPRPHLGFAVLLATAAAGLPAAAAVAGDRVDATTPSLEAGPRGSRTVGTRALRDAGEARLHEDLVRHAALEAAFSPHLAPGGTAVQVLPVLPIGRAVPAPPSRPAIRPLPVRPWPGCGTPGCVPAKPVR